MQFFKNLKNRIYGLDEFNYFLLVIWLILSVVGNIFKNDTVVLINTVLIIYILFRMVSSNKAKRFNENQKFLSIWRKHSLKGKQAINRFKDKKHNYYKCPNCKQYLCVPKGVGTVLIVCSKCKTQFKKKSK